MKEIYVSRMLFIIKNKQPINSLLDLGLEYSQIAQLLSALLKEGLLVDANENGLILSPQGERYLDNISKNQSSKMGSEWILPSDRDRINKIGVFDIYLPRKEK